ncbi:PAS domain-containing hybrid sensor histidine kinase/response regulator [Candidatus Symbiobacter mobilis]|uniref:Sensory/regulatory protein RpfC n=1 Tax=Candidatus Symbiobacter mobilis CR TaxID=946483 RepID=U5NAD7_9BURK|nr:PAS domain-containing hybrid sensor histidine kinase/response regulator [Candidatus Symbiobacter mobilis]AGX87164.1 signal transduction histidine kinase [Candidatus Symbiobacter mobilis CR]
MHTDAMLLEASSEMLFLLDAHSLHIVAASPGSHAQLGYPTGELLGKHISDIETALSDHFFWEEMATSQTPLEASGSYRRKDGTEFDIRKLARRSDLDPAYYVLRSRPARGPQKPGIVLADVGLHFAATLESTADAVLLTDTHGAIMNINRRFSALWSLPQTLLDEHNDRGIVAWIENQLRAAPGSTARCTTLHQVVMHGIDPVGDAQETLLLADGRIVETFSHPVRSREQTIGRVFFFRDMTEIKRNEAALQKARDEAECALESKGRFLANMSHEIRTPMNAVLGMLELLQDTDLSRRQLDYVRKADIAAHSLLGLLNDILDFSKIDAGKMVLDQQPFDLDALLREISVVLAATLGTKSVDVLFDVASTTPHHLVGDVLRLRQVLTNLGNNAIKFTHTGQVILRVRPVSMSETVCTLSFCVQDSGIGIAPEHLERIFEDFTQAETTTTRRFGGTGLGLSISRRLVALMGGTLRCESVPAAGSAFFFEIDLPLAKPASHQVLALDATAVLDVLVVDDNPVALELLGSMAQSLGWHVECAHSGAMAVDLSNRRARRSKPPYHAIFIDWDMPGMDGWETIAKIREVWRKDNTEPAKESLVVMVTAYDHHALMRCDAAQRAALHAYLVKPITASMLCEAVAHSSGQDAHILPGRIRTTNRGRLTGMRLLVVEDNLVNQQVAGELLSREGALVELADDGAAGVAAVARSLNSEPFDVVLMDMQMPVMDGLAAARAIRQELGQSEIPIIAMTANASAADREQCLAAGMNDHVGKPFHPDAVVELLLQHTGRAGTVVP